jgi:hypothetical protein
LFLHPGRQIGDPKAGSVRLGRFPSPTPDAARQACCETVFSTLHGGVFEIFGPRHAPRGYLMASRPAPLYTAANRAGARSPGTAASRESGRFATNHESDKAHSMSGFKEPSFADRQKAAQQARQNILTKFRSQPGVDDPAVAQRRAEREAQAAERAKAKLAREAEKAEQKRRDAEAAEQAAAHLAREKEEAAAREVALEAERKAARDARYAARKKRK